VQAAKDAKAADGARAATAKAEAAKAKAKAARAKAEARLRMWSADTLMTEAMQTVDTTKEGKAVRKEAADAKVQCVSH
jgi:hypothetical protein